MSLFHAGLQQALDSNGDPISGATWNFYDTGTTTPRAVYSNASLSTSLGSTVTANGAGRFANIFLDDAFTYRAILKDAGGTTIKDIDPANSDAIETIGPLRIGTSTDTASDNAVVIAGNDYTDDTGLTDSVHRFVTVGTTSYTSVAGGTSGNDYDTASVYDGDGVFGHHAHFQTGTVFRGNVEFTDVFGLTGALTVEENAQIGNWIFADFNEAAPTGTATVEQNIAVRYINSHFASDMTNITSATVNYALEVRKYLLDPATAYSASVFTEGQATFKAISASDSETSPYNTNGTLNTGLERFNCRVSAGQDGYFKFSNGSNIWRVGQPADSINLSMRSTAGSQNGLILNNVGVHSLNGTTLSAWNSSGFGFQIDKTSLYSTGGADLYFSSNAYYDGTNWKRIAAVATSQISCVGAVTTFRTAASDTANSTITWTTTATINASGHFQPGADNTQDCGTAALSWRGVYADTGFYVGGTKVVGAQGAAVADATDAATAITQLNALLARMRAHGLIAT